MSEKKPDLWMPLYIADYLADTTRLTTEQHGAYMLLIMDYWRNGPPPDDDAVLTTITKMTPDAWSNARAMLAHMFRIENGCWRHKRIDDELEEAKTNKRRKSKQASDAAKARWSKTCETDAGSNAESNARALPERCPSPSPSPNDVDDDTRDRKKFLDDIQNRLMEAGGAALDQVNGSQWHELHRPLAWLNAGCDFDLDVEPTVRRICERAAPGSISRWGYFEKAVMQAHVDRTRPVPQMQPRASPANNQKRGYNLDAINAAVAGLPK